jgi:hypothetical protein
MMKQTLLAVMLAASIGSMATPAAAEVYVRVAPPPPRSEPVPEARRGRVWVAGHWDWKNRRHQWVPGVWIRERPGYAYNQPKWVERNGRWQMQRGDWRRNDRDGDGVRNSQDRAPDNPNRR